MAIRSKVILFVFSGLACTHVMAQADNLNVLSAMDAIAAQRLVLAQEKKIVLDHFQEASKACWKQFAVNDCLFKARQKKYQDLSPLDQSEMTLNERQRFFKEIERQKRLTDKNAEISKDKVAP